MKRDTKICGIREENALTAAIEGGASYVGFVFYPPSPRHITPERAAALIARLPSSTLAVGLFVNANDAEIAAVLDQAPLHWLQCHGSESPERLREIKVRFGLPILKALPIAQKPDLEQIPLYETAADILLLDAKPAENREEETGGTPTPFGGRGEAFDWHLLEGFDMKRPWMLSGGLTPENVGQAIRITGTPMLDVSSGVESERGVKSPELIRAFLNAVRKEI